MRGKANPLKSFKTHGHGNFALDLEDIPVDFDAPINFHDLAKLCKNANTLALISRKYFVHPDHEKDPDLAITQQWFTEMSQTYDLLSFTHKKAAIEDMKKRVEAEIERKKYLKKLAANLADINTHLDHLDKNKDFLG